MAVTTMARIRPPRALAIVLATVAIAVASQLAGSFRGSLTTDNAPARPGAADATADGPGLDALTTGEAGEERDVDRIRANIAFWSERAAAHPRDFVAATQWAASEIDLARATGDITAYLRAEAALDGALRAYPDDRSAQGYRGVVLIALHKFADARDLAQAVLADRPNDPVALATLGDATLALGDVDAAETAYRALDTGARSSASLARLAQLAFMRGEATAALAYADDAVARSDDEGADAASAAWYRFQLAELRIAAGDRSGAASAYEAALTADPMSPLAHWGLARVAAADGRLDEAIAQLDAAIAIVPLPEYLSRRADLHALRAGPGDAAGATHDLETVEAIAQLAGDARSVYDRTLVMHLANHGLEPERALDLASRELSSRKDVYGYDAYAWALLANGRASEADAAMARALSLGTRDARLMYHAGMIAAALGDHARARTLLADALSLDPSFDPLQAARARETLGELP